MHSQQRLLILLALIALTGGSLACGWPMSGKQIEAAVGRTATAIAISQPACATDVAPAGARARLTTASLGAPVVAFSPDGETLAVGTQGLHLCHADGAGLAWSGAAGMPVSDVAFSPDGTMLASSMGNSTVILWDAQAGTQLYTLARDDAGEVLSVAFSPDGAMLASGWGWIDELGALVVWDVSDLAVTREPMFVIESRQSIADVAFSPDGVLLASAPGDSADSVTLWDATTGERVRTVENYAGSVSNRAVFSPDGATLASAAGGKSSNVTLWDAATGEQRVRILEDHAYIVLSVAFSPDRALLALAMGNGTVILWDVAAGKQVRVLEGHTGVVISVAFSPDGATLASGASDGTVILWDVSEVMAREE